MTKIIFLDIDEVIATTRSNVSSGIDAKTNKLDPIVLGLIDRLLDVDPETRVVIMSDWRYGEKTCDKILAAFREEGFTGKFHDDWRTRVLHEQTRGDEVREWLSRHPEVTNYICIDDSTDFYPDQHLVQVMSPDDGLSYKEFRQAQKLLYGNPDAWIDVLLSRRPENSRTSEPV